MQNIEQRTALVVDDDPGVRGTVKDILEFTGYNVLTAGNAEEAIKVLDEREKAELPIHRVYTDIRMPNKGDGMKLARQLAENPFMSNTKVVAMSGTMEDVTDEDRDLFHVRKWHFMDKPVDMDKIEHFEEEFQKQEAA